MILIRIRAEFFRSIKEEVRRFCDEERKGWSRELEVRRREAPQQEIVGEETMKGEVNAILVNHRHSMNCRLYLNWDYLCESLVKLRNRKKDGSIITISDLLAFQCLHCGHGGRDAKGRERREGIRQVPHSMFECKEKCCGAFLDRRCLQYKGGSCECGVVVMEYLGVKPANEDEHQWRLALYQGDFMRREADGVEEALGPTYARMGIKKPHMVTWYVMAKGSGFMGIIMRRSEHEKEATLWDIVRRINTAYSIHRPVQ